LWEISDTKRANWHIKLMSTIDFGDVPKYSKNQLKQLKKCTKKEKGEEQKIL